MVQSLQKQLDVCLDFYEGIDLFVRDNMHFECLLQEILDRLHYEKVDEEILSRLQQLASVLFNNIENNIRLLESHKESFAIMAVNLSDRMVNAGIQPIFDNKLNNGLVNLTENFNNLMRE